MAKKVQSFTFPEGGYYGGKKITVGHGDYDTICYELEYLGEYGIAWVVCYKDGTKKAQYNARYLESIVWAEEEE